MAIIAIDGSDFDTDKMSDLARQLINSLQFADNEIARLQARIALAQTARLTYANELKQALPKI